MRFVAIVMQECYPGALPQEEPLHQTPHQLLGQHVQQAGGFDRLDGGLAGLAVWLGGKSLHGERLALPRPPILSAMLADIKAVKLKPKKGRVKDLARIEDLLESLNDRMPPGP